MKTGYEEEKNPIRDFIESCNPEELAQFCLESGTTPNYLSQLMGRHRGLRITASKAVAIEDAVTRLRKQNEFLPALSIRDIVTFMETRRDE